MQRSSVLSRIRCDAQGCLIGSAFFGRGFAFFKAGGGSVSGRPLLLSFTVLVS